MRRIKISIGIILFLAVPGQIIWALVFWNNLDLFPYHWLVGFLALIPAPVLAYDLTKLIQNK